IVGLEKVPLKYPGLAPWEIWVSESQERMTLAVPKKSWKKFHAMLKKRGVEATIIGEFTDSGKCMVTFHGKTVMDMSLDFLHNGLQKREMRSQAIDKKNCHPGLSRILDADKTQKLLRISRFRTSRNDIKKTTKTLLSMLSEVNIAGYSFISQQYDYL